MIECQQYFFQGVKQIWSTYVISLIVSTENLKTLKLNSEISYFFFL